MKYYAITKGCYSDYHIITITADKEKAELIAKLHDQENNWKRTRVEEFEDSIEVLLPLFKVDYWDNDIQDIERIRECDIKEYDYYDYENEKLEINKVYLFPNESGLSVFIRTEDDEKAKKIAYDLIAEYKAKNEGIV